MNMNENKLYKDVKIKEPTDSSIQNKKGAQKELKDICQVFPFYEEHFENYKRIKNNSTLISKGLMQLLNPEIRDIFDALCESEALEQYDDNESNEIKFHTQSNEIKFFDIGNKMISNNVSVTHINIEKNDITENYQDTEIDTSKEIILNLKRKDNIYFK